MTTSLPEGDLAAAGRLTDPSPDVLRLVGRLAAVTAARMRLGRPLFGDVRPAGLIAVVVAAAVGAFRQGDRSQALLHALRPATRAADLLACHGIASRGVRLLPQLGDWLRDVSPLTGVLDRPGPRTVGTCETLLDRLRADPAARHVLVSRFAAPPRTPEQSRWRGECLAYLRHEDPDFVVEVYETALLYHARQHEVLVRAAWRRVLGPGPSDSTLATAYWWRALAELEAATPDRTRGLVPFELRRDGTNLFRRTQAWEAHENPA